MVPYVGAGFCVAGGGEELRVLLAFAMADLVSWAVDGDTFKLQSISRARGEGPCIDAFVTGFEQAQLLQVSVCLKILLSCQSQIEAPPGGGGRGSDAVFMGIKAVPYYA